MPANTLQRKICLYFEQHGGVAVLVKVTNQRGISDIWAVLNGKTYIIEVKQKYDNGTDTLKKLQIYQQNRFKQAGAITMVVWDYNEFLEEMEGYLCF